MATGFSTLALIPPADGSLRSAIVPALVLFLPVVVALASVLHLRRHDTRHAAAMLSLVTSCLMVLWLVLPASVLPDDPQIQFFSQIVTGLFYILLIYDWVNEMRSSKHWPNALDFLAIALIAIVVIGGLIGLRIAAS